MKLTDAIARDVPLPAGVADKVFFDDELPQFGVRVRAGSKRVWLVQYYAHGKVRRMGLGPIASVRSSAARKNASDVMARVHLGYDPAAEKIQRRESAAVAAAETIGAVIPTYLRFKHGHLRPRSVEEIRRHLETNAKPLHQRPIKAIDQREASRFLDKISEAKGPAVHNSVRTTLAAFYVWLRKKGMAETNPFEATVREAAVQRDRTLSLDELVEIWNASDACFTFGQIVKLLMLTGARRNEIAELRWSEVRDDMIVIPGARTKNKEPLEITLTPAMRQVIAGLPRHVNSDGSPRDIIFSRLLDGATRGFTGFSKSKIILDRYINEHRKAADPKAKPMESWRLHDFRRSFTTTVNESVPEWHGFIELCVNHLEGMKGGVKKHYNQALYRGPKAKVWELWNQILMDAIQGRDNNVVALRR